MEGWVWGMKEENRADEHVLLAGMKLLFEREDSLDLSLFFFLMKCCFLRL